MIWLALGTYLIGALCVAIVALSALALGGSTPQFTEVLGSIALVLFWPLVLPVLFLIFFFTAFFTHYGQS